jgi:hypothetical protein
LELLKRAAQEPVEITLNSSKQATRLCFQLNSLRKAMRLEGHPLVRIVSAVNVSVTSSGNLLVRPADSNFLAAIHAAGISVSDAPFVPPVLPPTITEYSIPRTAKEAPTEIPPTPSNAQGQGDEEAQAALRAFLTDTDSALTSTKTETETLETPEPKESIQ